MAEFTNPEGPSGFQPTAFKPIRAADVKSVKENYGIGTQPRFARGSADSELYKFSAKAVIDWWKKLKAQEAADAASAGAGGSPGSAGAPAGGGGGGGGGGGPVFGPPSPLTTGAGAKPNRGITPGVDATPPRPPTQPPAPRAAPPPPRRTIASESITAGVTRLAPKPPAPKPKPGTRYRPAGGNTGFRAY